MRVNGFAPVAGISADFTVQYRTSLPLVPSDLDFYGDLLAKINTNSNLAETHFEICNCRDEPFIHCARLMTDDECPNLYMYTPTAKVPIVVCEKTRISVIRYVIRKILESMNDVLDGKIPSPVIKTPTKEEYPCLPPMRRMSESISAAKSSAKTRSSPA